MDHDRKVVRSAHQNDILSITFSPAFTHPLRCDPEYRMQERVEWQVSTCAVVQRGNTVPINARRLKSATLCMRELVSRPVPL